VTPDVLVPRPETELLVETVVGLCAEPRERGLTVWDAGTGSGCLAVALARELPRARILATDVSRAALEVARRNAVALQVADRILLACVDLDDGLRTGHRFDVVVSNPPYLAEGEAVPPELDWEPAGALAAGAHGLDVIQRLLRQASSRLRRSGLLVMEMGFGQEAAVRRLAAAAGLVDVSVRADYAGIPRVLIGRVVADARRGEGASA
jgi:release factor glutamine methyltransferase